MQSEWRRVFTRSPGFDSLAASSSDLLGFWIKDSIGFWDTGTAMRFSSRGDGAGPAFGTQVVLIGTAAAAGTVTIFWQVGQSNC